jgi:uracil-DNA glycosylase family 4
MPHPELAELIADVREQVLFMRELGVDALAAELNERPAILSSVKSLITDSSRAVKVPPLVEISVSRKENQSKAPGSRLAALPSLSNRPRSAPLEGFGAPGPISSSDMTKNVSAASEVLIDVAPRLEETADTIESIRAEIGPDCTRCRLGTLGRKQVVNSTGNFNAQLIFVGEAPGADEDEQGFPFVGRAGQLLTKIIESIELKREDVFIGNINRCRPPGNRQPEPDETAQCRPFILREITVIKPKVIVVLGATAAHNLLQVKTPISRLRGHFHDYFGVKVMPTFHPAYLLRDPHKKREVWEDMKMVREFLNKSND